MKQSLVALFFWICASGAAGAEIPRDGSIKAPTTSEAMTTCKNSIEGDVAENKLVYCVVTELESAENVIRLISDHPEVASEAYWGCVDNPYIKSFTQLDRCMTIELETYLQQYEAPTVILNQPEEPAPDTVQQ